METFHDAFERLTGNPPFPWQAALFDSFMSNDLPETCNLPTGLGKTSIMAIWLIALAHAPRSIPRRLVYVVNRRTVVDQSTDEAEKLRQNLPKCPGLVSALRRLCTDPADSPLAVSTLRGQFADNAEWRDDPSRPAIISGTVDMIGSRLLFSGFRCGFKSKPAHAALLGQDSLLIHDEAHLEPAFQRLLLAIRREQTSGRFPDIRPMRVMELTATNRAAPELATDPPSKPPFGLQDADHENEIVRRRIHASKGLRFHALGHGQKLADVVVEHSMQYIETSQAILIFLRTVEDVEKVAAALKAATKNRNAEVEQLTGTLRGLERDELARSNPVFARFLPAANRRVPAFEETSFLICTSAGEVGVNISADHLVCDLSTYESMAQRFGRVNRFGEGDAHIDVVFETDMDADNHYHACRVRTLELLQRLPEREDGRLDASPAALSTLPADHVQSAFAPEPKYLLATDILFDAWALTSILDELPGRPPVDAWLHGLADDMPHTYVAWREEVQQVNGELLAQYPPEQMLEAFPLKPLELLQDRTDRVFAHLQRIAAKNPREPVWIIDHNGEIDCAQTLATVAPPDAKGDQAKRFRERLANVTLLLPPTVGGLSHGMLSGDAEYQSGALYDVSEKWGAEEGLVRRQRCWGDEQSTSQMRKALQIVLTRNAGEQSESEEADDKVWTWYVRPRSADDDEGQSWSAPFRQELDAHLRLAATIAESITSKLHLDDAISAAVAVACRYHDIGKARRLWQIGIGNNEYDSARLDTILAKSGNSRPPVNRHYRHEFGTLMDLTGRRQSTGDAMAPIVASAHEDLTKLAPMCDLVFHLIGAHHGRARPHFPASDVRNESFDPEAFDDGAQELAADVPQRFGRLQRQYGRWGLAWLESIVRAADALASRNPTNSADVASGRKATS